MRSLLAFWIGGAGAAAPTADAGVRSLLAPWIGGASAPAGDAQAGVRGLLAPWIGGAGAAPVVDQFGLRGLLAFWLGGVSATPGTAPEPEDETLGGSRFRGVTGYAAETTALDFDRVSRRRIKRAMSEAVAQVGTALTDAEAFVVEQSLRAFLASGTKRSTNAVQQFITETIASLQRADLERRAASQQFAEDQLDAIAQQRRDNRRRAIILIILLMLS